MFFGYFVHTIVAVARSSEVVLLTEPSALGLLIKDSQQDWLSKIDDDSRETFVNTVFSLFEATGMSTFGEMKDNMLKAGEKIFSSMKGLPKERQEEVKDIVSELIKSSTQAAKDRLSDMI